MNVIRADVLGMCAGVRRAIDIAYDVDQPRGVAILGELVHNRQVCDGLCQRGFAAAPRAVQELLPAAERILIPAHGLGGPERQALESAGKTVIDATCPFVRRIQETARQFAREGRLVIVVGKRGHAEVASIIAGLDARVAGKADEVMPYGAARLGIVVQSTMAGPDADALARAIRAANPGSDTRYCRSVCSATRDRQEALRNLLGHVDAVVVVGGRNSNNTLELVRIVTEEGVAAHHVETEKDLRPDWFYAAKTVGLTAGASTPDYVIDAVERWLRAAKAALRTAAV